MSQVEKIIRQLGGNKLNNWKESFGATEKLRSYDLIITSSSHRNSLLQCKIRLSTKNSI